jgi:hypothetical protein
METFVVRVWVPGIEGPAGEPQLRGFVTAAASGLTLPFYEESELVALVKDAARGAPATTPSVRVMEGESR